MIPHPSLLVTLVLLVDRRQHSLGRYVADFYCEAARLVIEVDGSIHEEENQKEYDSVRDAMLTAFGCLSLHFTTEEIKTQLPEVLQHIHQTAALRLPSSPIKE